MDKVEGMSEQMRKVRRKMEIPRRHQNQMLEIKGIATEMQNNVDGLISRWDMAEGRISEFEDISIETSKTEKQ